MATRRSGRSAKKMRWGLWLRRAAMCFLLTSLVALAYYVTAFTGTAEEFSVRVVHLEGLNHLTEETVLAAAGVHGGDNIVQLDRVGLAAKVKALPYAKEAEIAVVFPDTLIVRVVERSPVASAIVRNNAYELDRSGVLLRKYGPSELPMPPMITEIGEVDVVEVGDVLELDHLQRAFEVWEAFRETEIGANTTVSEIAARSMAEIVLFTNELPFEIRWGRSDPAAQALRLDALWRDQGGELPCLEYLDLRFDEDLICK